MDFKTAQEAFWAGEFGDCYIDRNRSSGLLHSTEAIRHSVSWHERQPPHIRLSRYGKQYGLGY